MIVARGWLACGGLALAVAACGDAAPDVHYRLIGLPRATAAGCAAVAAAAPVVPGATRVRLTFRDQTATGVGGLRCDVVLPIGGATPTIAVPRRGDPVAIWAEYFDDAGTLLARGERHGVDLDGGDTVTVAAGPAGDYACAPVQPTVGRAFHSATALPTGEVLLLGGLTGTLGGDGSFLPDDGAYAIAGAELYDPVTGTVTAVAIPGLLARAFHQAVVVGEDDRGVHILVVGGSGVANDPTSPGNVAALPGSGGAPPWRPAGVDIARGRYGARALPAEYLTYHPETRTFTRLEVGAAGPTLRLEAAVSPIAYPGGPVAVVGGRMANGNGTDLIEGVRPTDGSVAGTVGGRVRVGATVTMLPAGDAIVIGGDLANDATVRAVDHLTMLGGAPGLDAGPADTVATNRAYHAAAMLLDHVIAIGGLRVGGTGVEDQGPGALAVRISNTTLAAVAIDTAAAPVAALAYLDAITLQDGGVLAAGGATPGTACGRTILCPTTASLRLDPDGGTARVTAAGALGQARYGHRMVRLGDGTVLVTGGFVVDPADPLRLRATAAIEQFEAHRAADDPLAELMIPRAAGDVARDARGRPIAPCTRIGAEVDALTVDAALDAPIDAP